MKTSWQGVVEEIRRAWTPRGRRQTGCFAIEGLRLHERAVRAGYAPSRVLVSESLASSSNSRAQRLLTALRGQGVAVCRAPDRILEDLVEGRGRGEIAGLVPLPAPVSLDAMLETCGDEARPVVVAVDIFDPGNSGALVRTALAGNARLFVAVGSTDPYHPKAVQTSMGSLFKVPVVSAGTGWLNSLKDHGYSVVGLDCQSENVLVDAELAGARVAVVVGSESSGLSPAVLGRLDVSVRIPMPQGVDSYSVNAATAIALYELYRRFAQDDGLARRESKVQDAG